MDLHRVNEERSVAYHRSVAEKLRLEPVLLEQARARVAAWQTGATAPRFYAEKWADVLNRDLGAICQFLVERSDFADELRQSSPFAGSLSPQERWRIWREVRDQLANPE